MNTSKSYFDALLKIYKFNDSSEENVNDSSKDSIEENSNENKVHGFLVKSTAPINVEDDNNTNIPENCTHYFSDDFEIEENISKTVENISKTVEKFSKTVEKFYSKNISKTVENISKPVEEFYSKNISKTVENISKTAEEFYLENISKTVENISKTAEELYLEQTSKSLKFAKRKIDPEHINKITEILVNGKTPEIVIKIHGYSSKEEDVIKEYYDLFNKYKSKPTIDKTVVFFGYRWPSESPNTENIFKTLPILLGWISYVSISGIIGVVVFSVLILLGIFDKIPLLFDNILFTLLWTLFLMILTLMLLRFSAYFRDSFRANNYAVLDLIELIKQLDEAIYKKISSDENQNRENINIKLNFIAHSMGCHVTTSIIRILADVFDNNNSDNNSKNPTNIGKCFTLERLIMVAPDIPVEAIISRRANFLQDSLSRCKESYIFSNEGDIILRLASTAANYFSFPSKDLFSGYRLGNITVGCSPNGQNCSEYGIVNLDNNKNSKEPLELLEIRSSNKTKLLKEFIKLNGEQENNPQLITNKFTYFDCTDYKDSKDKKGFVSLATKKERLNWFDYLHLVVEHFIFGNIDTHGGYFKEGFSNDLINNLAFFGFEHLLHSYPSDEFDSFSKKCKEKQIRVVLSSDFSEHLRKPLQTKGWLGINFCGYFVVLSSIK